VSKSDPAAAMAAAAKLDNEKARGAATAMTAGTWANSSPAEAAEFAAHLPKGPSQVGAGLSVAANWAERDPASAAQWVITFPEGGARSQHLKKLSRQRETGETGFRTDEPKPWPRRARHKEAGHSPVGYEQRLLVALACSEGEA
jgi:hypothetical protein